MMVIWIAITEQKPSGRMVLLKTDRFYHIHCMCSFRTGEEVAWDDQPDKWFGFEIDKNAVTHWARLDGNHDIR